MKINRIYLYSSVFILTLLIVPCCTNESSPPRRPENVPKDAVYSGNLESGHWVHCTNSNNLYDCQIYQAGGALIVESKFILDGNGSDNSNHITRMFFNLTYIETDAGNLIPVGSYKIYEPETGWVTQERFYAAEKCRKDVGEITDADASSVLENFIRKYRKELVGMNFTLRRSQRYVSRNMGRGFTCSGVDLKSFIFKALRNKATKMTAFVAICADCDYEVSLMFEE